MAKQQRGRKPRFKREKPEFDQQIVDLARVTRVTKGGKQMNFRCCILIGDRKGRVGYGVQKGSDVQIAIEKAVRQAKKQMITVPIVDGTLPHTIEAKFKAAKVLLKPAPVGSGIIAGSVIRSVLEMAGVPNASSKMLGKTNNKVSNVKAVFEALQSFHPVAVEKAKKKEAAKKMPKKTVVTQEKKEEKKDDTKKESEGKKKAPAKKTTKKAAAKKPAEKKTPRASKK